MIHLVLIVNPVGIPVALTPITVTLRPLKCARENTGIAAIQERPLFGWIELEFRRFSLRISSLRSYVFVCVVGLVLAALVQVTTP